jgi:hypothetical protein
VRAPSRRLFRHRAQVWEATETVDDIGRARRSWAPWRDGIAEVQHRRVAQVDQGPGEAPAGQWMVYFPQGERGIEGGMVIEVYQGPNAPRLLKVENDYTPRGRFWQVTCSEWLGSLLGGDES